MSRRMFILVFAAICWSVVAIDGLVNAIGGNFLVPAGQSIAFMLWLALWQRYTAGQGTRAAVPVEA